ncbi:MAG: diacylglycerol/polyprenol kinase family protein [Dehalococcoidia bacterium]
MSDSGQFDWLPARKAPPVGRRLFHIFAGSSVPLAGIFAPPTEFLIVLGILAMLSLGLDLVRFRVSWLNRYFVTWLAPLLKSDEDRHLTGATYLLLSAFVAFLFFSQPVAVLATFFLALGDPAAALAGRPAPGPRFFGKSPVGSTAFVVVSLLVVGALITAGLVQYHWAYLAGALVAGLVELTPIPLDDNLTIPLVSGAAMQLATL